MKNLDTKAVIITGAVGLLGTSIVRYFIDAGWHVIGVDINDTLFSCNEEVSYIKFDLADINNYARLISEVALKTENLKCLINNAAFNPKVEEGAGSFGKFEDIALCNWDKEVRLNMTAPVFLIKELLDVFNTKSRGNCKIINVISTYGLVAPNQDIYKSLSKRDDEEVVKPLSYSVTKAGLAMVTKYLSVYLAKRGFNVNGIAPGGIENGQPAEFVEAYSKLTPMGRMAKTEDMMGVLMLLSSEGSDYMTGQIIAVDGGWTVW